MHTEHPQNREPAAGPAALPVPGQAAVASVVPDQAAIENPDVWKVYLVECADGTYYCGVAKQLERRVAQHNGLRPGGAKYTRPRRPVKLVAVCPCPDKRDAYSLEAAVKAVPRGKKLDLIRAHAHKWTAEPPAG